MRSVGPAGSGGRLQSGDARRPELRAIPPDAAGVYAICRRDPIRSRAGLERLFLVPDGMCADQGLYIRCPFEGMLAVTVLLSLEMKCIVIGEDLGTVPDDFRQALADWGVWSYQVMLFERSPSGDFSPPESDPENAVVTFATHDLPTYAGWKEKRDMVVKQELGMETGETDEQRDAALEALRRALNEHGSEPITFPSIGELSRGDAIADGGCIDGRPSGSD